MSVCICLLLSLNIHHRFNYYYFWNIIPITFWLFLIFNYGLELVGLNFFPLKKKSLFDVCSLTFITILLYDCITSVLDQEI